MIQKYTFSNGTIEFENTKTIHELIEYAFDEFDYYEPMGINRVTIFQAHHPKTNTGWFTSDTNLKCVDEILNPDELCFAYYMPDAFYYAEGGWGHHMIELGNHPNIPNAVSIKIKFEDFNNTIVINGSYSFRDIVTTLQKFDYVSYTASQVKVLLAGYIGNNYSISISDKLLDLPLVDFLQKIQIKLEEKEREQDIHIYYEVFEII